MADHQVGNIHGVTASHVGDADTLTNINGNDVPDAGYFDADSVTISAMKARLQVIDAGYYTDAKLNEMTYNDMVYAIRVADAPTTVK